MVELNASDAASMLIVLAFALGYRNHRFHKVPSMVGLMLTGAVAAILVLVHDHSLPYSTLAEQLAEFLRDLDFHTSLTGGMLSFLLIAGAVHVDWTHMRKRRWLILLFSIIGILTSTALVGYAGESLFYGGVGVFVLTTLRTTPLFATFAVVLFAVLIQGRTVGWLIEQSKARSGDIPGGAPA